MVLAALLSACATYSYPVRPAGEGVYLAESPPNYIHVRAWYGYPYYNPWYYPYYSSLWYGPVYWYPPYRWPPYHHHYRPPYRGPVGGHDGPIQPRDGTPPSMAYRTPGHPDPDFRRAAPDNSRQIVLRPAHSVPRPYVRGAGAYSNKYRNMHPAPSRRQAAPSSASRSFNGGSAPVRQGNGFSGNARVHRNQ